MGCDIYTYVEVRTADGWRQVDVPGDDILDGRNYGMFGFLADVRNYSHVPVIAEPRGLPADVSPSIVEGDEGYDWHFAHSWLTLAELLAYDYDQVFWDRRVTKQLPSGAWDGAALAEEGEGEHVTLRSFLGEWFFKELDRLAALGAPDDVRVVFWFAG